MHPRSWQTSNALIQWQARLQQSRDPRSSSLRFRPESDGFDVPTCMGTRAGRTFAASPQTDGRVEAESDARDVDADLLYYVMPRAEGESLRDRLDREGPLSVSGAVGNATEVADALDYAHERGIVHRDVKPANILLEGGHARSSPDQGAGADRRGPIRNGG